MTDRGNFAEILDGYLRALEAGDAPEREALLATHPDLAEELQAALLGIDFVHSAAPRLAPEDDADAQPGRLLGDYRLLRELGRGGMAVVYEAEQVSLGRRVALKVLPFAAVLDGKQLQRFKNEAMAAAHLRHKNIVPVYGVGCERGVHYYAMQFIEGQSLATAIRDLKGGGAGEGPTTPISSHGSNREPAYIRMAAALGVQAAEALDHAHQLGIVHRDVKPGNLLVDQAGTLWVTDFGLASSVADVGLTATGELLGTIRYMSPEQALAKRVPIDHRTDVYSLGATLYEFFTLEPAFPGDDPHLVIQDIASREPVAPRKLNPALPRDLETVILKAMSKEPAGRYATAQEMANDLGRFLEDKPIEAKRPGLLRRASKWGRRHRTLVGATAALLLLSTLGLATGTALLWREEAETEAALESAQANLDLALQVLDQIYIDEAEGYPKIREGLPKDLLEKGLGFYEAFVKQNAGNKGLALLAGLAYQRAGLIFRELGEEEQAVESFKRAISAYEQAIEIDPRFAVAHTNRGNALCNLGRFEEALAAYDRAIDIDPRDARAHFNRGITLGDLGLFEEKLAAFDRAIEIDPRFVAAHYNAGNALKAKGEFEAAIGAYREAIRLKPDFAEAHCNLGVALKATGDRGGAIASYREAARVKPDLVEAHYNLGIDLTAKGEFEAAIAACREAIRLDPDRAEAHCEFGKALAAKGEFEAAIAAYHDAIRIDPDFAEAHYCLGNTLDDKGDTHRAIEEYIEAIRIRPDYAEAHCNVGHALVTQTRFSDALPWLRKGHELGSMRPDWDYPSGEWIESAERKAELAGRLDQVLSGKARPRDAVERIEFASVLYDKARHAESARMYAEAFAEDAVLAEDLGEGHRYDAACSASLEAARGGADASEWRGRALEWLRADLAAREKAATGLVATLEHWKKDPDLASVRDRLDDLPEPERAAWRGLWAAVDLALAAARPAAK